MINEHGGNGMNAAQMLGVAGGMDSDGDDGLGDVASPEQMAGRKGAKLGKKKKKMPGPPGQQRKVINNYMADK
jgi:hypothetical protein